MTIRKLSYIAVGLFVLAVCFGQWACSKSASEQSNAAATAAQSPSPSSQAAPGSPEGLPSSGATSANPDQAGSGAGGGSMASARSGGQGSAAGSAPSSTIAQPPPPPRRYTLPAGSRVSVFTTRGLSTKTAKAGDTFTATLARSIVDHGWVIARQGAPVEGVVLSSDPGGRVKGVASLTVALKRLTLADGRTVALSTSGYTKKAPTTRKKDAAKIGIGAGVGALIGAIAGGKKGAAIGAGAGGGAGTAYVLATHGDPAVIPGESHLTFRLNSPVTVTQRVP
jgi:hypothetical protein